MSELNTNLILANIISLFHLGIVLFILLAPFCNIPAFLILHFVFSVSLIVHWIGNENICSLSVMESKLRGLHYTESYSHKFIAPIYDISETDWITTCYIIVITLMLVSLYALYYSERIQNMKIYYNNTKMELLKQKGGTTLNWSESIAIYDKCIRFLI
jgi:hypothetical protein